jgi:hypothetical protein
MQILALKKGRVMQALASAALLNAVAGTQGNTLV